jgi:hypothetical protein
MPEIGVVNGSRPAPRSTVSVVEYAAAISPTPRPATVITIAPAGARLSEGQRHGFEVIIEQVGPAVVNVTVAGKNWLAEMDMFRAENRYVSLDPVSMSVGM